MSLCGGISPCYNDPSSPTDAPSQASAEKAAATAKKLEAKKLEASPRV
eukprot:COSAG05_NODE_9391_length_627_cov_0.829545_1_plen_47_part_10